MRYDQKTIEYRVHAQVTPVLIRWLPLLTTFDWYLFWCWWSSLFSIIFFCNWAVCARKRNKLFQTFLCAWKHFWRLRCDYHCCDLQERKERSHSAWVSEAKSTVDRARQSFHQNVRRNPNWCNYVLNRKNGITCLRDLTVNLKAFLSVWGNTWNKLRFKVWV